MKQNELFDKDEESKALTVTELTGRIRECLEEQFPDICVVGEISNFRRPASGHIYLTLKDETSQLRVVMFRNITTRSWEDSSLRVR